VTSPDPSTTADAQASPVVTRRSRKSWRLAVSLVAIVAVMFASAACTPKMSPQEAVRKHWGKLTPCAERIVKRESGYNPEAVNKSSGATGLFQLMPSHARWIKSKFGYDFSEMKDAEKNAEVAKALSAEAYRYWGDGWQPWRLSSRAIPGGGCPA
jgi:soluble lytic murein transglycosylase-like protein